MAVVVWVGRRLGAAKASRPWLLLIVAMIATVSVLMMAHACEVVVWALAYAIVGAAPPRVDLVYFAFVNYTTLGYGDVNARGALAAARSHDGNERRPVVWLVDRRYL